MKKAISLTPPLLLFMTLLAQEETIETKERKNSIGINVSPVISLLTDADLETKNSKLSILYQRQLRNKDLRLSFNHKQKSIYNNYESLYDFTNNTPAIDTLPGFNSSSRESYITDIRVGLGFTHGERLVKLVYGGDMIIGLERIDETHMAADPDSTFFTHYESYRNNSFVFGFDAFVGAKIKLTKKLNIQAQYTPSITFHKGLTKESTVLDDSTKEFVHSTDNLSIDRLVGHFGGAEIYVSFTF